MKILIIQQMPLKCHKDLPHPIYQFLCSHNAILHFHNTYRSLSKLQYSFLVFFSSLLKYLMCQLHLLKNVSVGCHRKIDTISCAAK